MQVTIQLRTREGVGGASEQTAWYTYENINLLERIYANIKEKNDNLRNIYH